MCVFRYLYCEKPESEIGSINVGHFRYELGFLLGKNLPRDLFDEVDYVVPIPNTGILYAKGLAEAIGVPFCAALKKGTEKRCLCFEKADLREQFLNDMIQIEDTAIRGKRLLLVDEAILTGTTMKSVCSRLHQAGAAGIRVCVPSPVSNCRCQRGVMGQLNSLYANTSVAEFASALGVEGITHISQDLFHRFLREKGLDVCTECFDLYDQT